LTHNQGSGNSFRATGVELARADFDFIDPSMKVAAGAGETLATAAFVVSSPSVRGVIIAIAERPIEHKAFAPRGK